MQYEYYQERDQINPISNESTNGLTIDTNCNYFLFEINIALSTSDFEGWDGRPYGITDVVRLKIDGVAVGSTYQTNFDLDTGFRQFICNYKYESPVCTPDVHIKKPLTIENIGSNQNYLFASILQDVGIISLSMTRGYFKKI